MNKNTIWVENDWSGEKSIKLGYALILIIFICSVVAYRFIYPAPLWRTILSTTIILIVLLVSEYVGWRIHKSCCPAKLCYSQVGIYYLTGKGIKQFIPWENVKSVKPWDIRKENYRLFFYKGKTLFSIDVLLIGRVNAVEIKKRLNERLEKTKSPIKI